MGRAHRRVNRSLADLFALLVEVDTEEVVAANAMTDAVGWLCFDLGLRPRTARAWVRAAHTLTDLPETAAAFRAGDISLDEVLILTRHATADNETMLLGLTREVPTDELAAAIRDLLAEPTKQVPPQCQPKPRLRTWWDDNELQLQGSIPGADGVLVETTLMRLGAQAPTHPDSGVFRDPVERAGEALVQLASEATVEDRDHDRATLVIHIGIDQLDGDDPTINFGDRTYRRDELLRICCDARIQPALDDANGITLGIGRASRQIPPWLRKTLTNRDKGCRFPGCWRTRWTHAHHITHWADGGPTNLDNLITLCGYHHRLIHRRHWTIDGNPNHKVTFHTEWGTPHEPIRRVNRAWHNRLVEHINTTYTPHRLRLLANANAPP